MARNGQLSQRASFWNFYGVLVLCVPEPDFGWKQSLVLEGSRAALIGLLTIERWLETTRKS